MQVHNKGFRIVICCDNGTEQKNKNFRNLAESLGIEIQFTSTYSPQSNGVAERGIQTIMKMVRCLRLSAHLPEQAIAELIFTASYLDSLSPTVSNPNMASPYEMMFDTVPDIAHLRVIGSKAFLHK